MIFEFLFKTYDVYHESRNIMLIKDDCMVLFLDKKIKLKQDVLRILNYKNDFVTTEELAELIPYASFSTIRSICYELRDEIKEVYSEHEATLIINPSKGVRYVRHNISSQKINHYILSNHLFHDILVKILKERHFNVFSFLEENYISKSTLYNSIKKINARLNEFDLHISMSHQVKIVGKEHHIRLFSFLYFFHTLDIYEDGSLFSMSIKDKTRKILHYLEIDYLDLKLPLTELIVLVSELGIQPEADELLFFKETAKNFSFPKKPQFLASYSEYSWKILLLMLYSLNIVDFEIPRKKILYEKEIDDWITCYEESYAEISPYKKETLIQNFTKTLLLYHFFRISDVFIRPIDIPNFDGIKKNFPKFKESFDLFYERLSTKNSLYEDSYLLREISEYLVSLTYTFPDFATKAAVYVLTDSHLLFKKNLEEKIMAYLNYFVTLTQSIEEADIIVSTMHIKNSEQKVIEVDPDFSTMDLANLNKAVIELIEKKYLVYIS